MAKKDRSMAIHLGDFTASPRVVLISLFALFIGIISSFVALILLRLIGIFTNLFFFQRWGTDLVSPAGNHLGVFVIIVPIIGALIIGFMARYGSERIRGHGIPEAIEAILMNNSKIQPRVALLKPLSSAISIGSGGPFGAEGPIIMTGGAVGSILAQFFHLTSTERKTLLVAGAAAGMSATFAAPVAAVMLAVELLLFEWKPRSLIPVAIASATAAVTRQYIIGTGPLFPIAAHPAFISLDILPASALAGLLAGAASALLTLAVYAGEDLFKRLPIHWMWWPALGGLIIGIGGFIFPQALGVGYDTIGSLLQGNTSLSLLLGVLFVKSIIWSFSLGSGTSGGVLAPLLMVGGALGAVESFFLPHVGVGFWPLISMAAILGGTMGAPFTGIFFAVELTHDINALIPLLFACSMSYGLTVLMMRRSILTEKVSRRGYHLSREYATDPLEILFVRDVVRTKMTTFSLALSADELQQAIRSAYSQHGQHLYPVLDHQERLVGVLTRGDVYRFLQQEHREGDPPDIQSFIRLDPIVCYPDEPLRMVVYRMAEHNLTRLLVVDRADPTRLLGMVSLNNLLKARVRDLQEERQRERILRLRLLSSKRPPLSRTSEHLKTGIAIGQNETAARQEQASLPE